ncbi:nudC domain-containing protein 1 isoform X1 [Orcinus orca]|uniref:NudC domain-containing protein 1 n=1 Tax=Tursiops truncatus TaxID=9739 RepID=A0A6J3Q8X0_TURTR|nr:nudC domain-containing protein 1 isoform X1 [Orcinus orca]XP_030718962.1 nudC domain-containing protein 1 isoform X1 [Globicephala melas]XP_033698568.1 nudC domain-containing protein 1 isoform X1 [Tursiops truncatus]XP_059851050.1 nudC domain-containing protein 1 isoform X1 [Delphinus delphis]XP_059984119.1 nudC domain-containing protein 1 isoform X1 [Lagenorhynchus albirostris]
MEVAANCSLRVKRPLLDPRFEGYKLSLEPLPCYQLELDAAVAEVKLRDDQYTLEHMHAFGMYNYLHCDSWYQDSVYYVDNLGRIMNLTVMLDTALGKPREVFRLPTDLIAYDNRLCASMHFTSSTWVTLSDGTGRLYLIGTGERGNSASEKWEIMFNEELGNPFIIIHSISLLKAEEHSIATLLLRIEKEELDMKGSGFYVSLEWVTINKKSKDKKKYEITKRNILRGKSVPHYAAIEPNGNGLMIVSYKSFTFVQVGQNLEESKDEDMSEKIKEPLYYWQQTEDDLTVTISLPEDCTKEDIQIQFLPDHVNVVLKGQRFLEGNLYSSIDHESSTWIIKENNSLEISLIKKNEGLTWPELVVGDKQGEFIRDSAQCAAIAERLMHLTSDELNPNPDKGKPPCNAQELEECDIFFEESSSLCRFDGSTLKTTHVVNLGSNQYLFSVIVDPKEMPCFCLRHDVDALLWQPHSGNQDDMWEHIATFNALGYVQASKRDKKFFACAPNYSYAALCECLRRVFIYRQPTPMSTVLYNRKEGRQVGQVAKQQVASLETSDPILGFQATNERLFVLTTKNLFLIKVNTEN